MTKHHKRTRRTRRVKKGGFWPFTSSETASSSYTYTPSTTPSYSTGSSQNSIGSTISNTWSSVSQGATDLWDKAKKSVSGSNTSAPVYNAPAQSSYMGGKRHKKRGGTRGWTPLTGIASHAADFFGKSAQPQAWVGGKRRTKRRGTHKRRSTRRR